MPRGAREKIDAAERLFVACSGGADSVFALLCCYLYLRSQDGLGRLSVLHLNHRLRAEASDEDARFVAELCESLEIPCIQGEADWEQPVTALNEADARAARLRFFEEATESPGEGPALIATGHHADDIVENMLMRLSRGSGLQGLSAPREVSSVSGRIQFLRPILDFEREEIRSVLRDCAIPWREDETNRSEANYRARLRRKVVPVWNEVCDREVVAGVRRSRRLLAEDWEALEAFAGKAWRKIASEDGTGLRRSDLLREPVAIQRRLLHLLIERSGRAGLTLGASVADSVLEDLKAGNAARYEVGEGLWLSVEREWVRRERNRHTPFPEGWGPFSLPLGCIAYLPDGGMIKAELVSVTPELLNRLRLGQNDNAIRAYMRVDEERTKAVGVRRRRPGDAFKPYGKTSAKKLKALFIDYKITVEERDRLPIILTSEGEIVWVPGLPPHGDLALGPDCKAALRLTYQR